MWNNVNLKSFCKDWFQCLEFHHPMPSVEAGRSFVMASGRVGGSEGWEPLNMNPFGSPVVAPGSDASECTLMKKSLLVVLATFYKLDQCCEPCINHPDMKTSCFHAFRMVCVNWRINQFKSVHGVFWLRPVRALLAGMFCTIWDRWKVTFIR